MDLRDLRAKVTVEADCALDAQARATGRDRSEIVREVLHVWALQQIHTATLLRRRLNAEGIAGPVSGEAGP